MKKIFTLFILLLIPLINCFADVSVEMDLNVYSNIVNMGNITDKSKPENTYHHPDSYVNNAPCLGFENNFTFYFGKTKILNAGLYIEDGLGLFIDSSEFNYDENFELFLKLGPAFQFDLGKFSSIFIAPCISLNGITAVLSDYDNTMISLTTFNFETDICHKLWIVNKKDYHFGFSTGVTLGFPIYGDYGTSDANIIASFFEAITNAQTNKVDFKDQIEGGFKFKCYAGLCFYFGTRPYDRRQAEASSFFEQNEEESKSTEPENITPESI